MEFDSYGLQRGIWSGALKAATPPERIMLFHQGVAVAEARLTPGGDAGIWLVSVPLAPELLSDGVQSFILMAGNNRAGDAASVQIGSLQLVSGKMPEADLLAEISLMRAELDLLKREIRRLGRRG